MLLRFPPAPWLQPQKPSRQRHVASCHVLHRLTSKAAINGIPVVVQLGIGLLQHHGPQLHILGKHPQWSRGPNWFSTLKHLKTFWNPKNNKKNAVLEILIHVQLFFWGLYYDGWNLSTSKQWMVYTETKRLEVSASWSMFGTRNQTIEVGKRPILRADFTLHSLWRGDDLNSYCRLPKCAQFYLAVSSLEQICWSRLSWDLDFQWCFHTSIIVNFSTCRFLVQSHASLHSWGCLLLGILWFATSHRSQSGLSKRWWDLD